MKDESKTKKQLIKELKDIRLRNSQLEASEKKYKKAEEALRLMKFSVDKTSDAVFLLGPDARFLYVNDAACSSLGFSRRELLSMSVHDIDPDFPQEVWPDHWRELKKRKSFTIHSHHRTKKGRVFPVEIKINFLKYKGKEYNCAFARDISVFEQTEEVLRESRKVFSDLYDSAPTAYFSVASDGHIIRCNKKAVTLLGYPREELIGLKIFDLYADTSHGKEKAINLFKHFETGMPLSDEELQIKKADGTSVWVSLTVNATRDPQGRILENRFMIMDITDRKHAEQQLSIFKKFVEVSSLAYGFAHLDGSIVYINPTLCRILGEENPENALGKNVELYYPGNTKYKLINEVLPTVKREGGWIGELPLMSVTGYVTPTIQNISLIRNDKGDPLYIGNVITDITELKNAQAALNESETKFRTLVEQLPNTITYVAALDEWSTTLYISPQSEHILGYSKDEFMSDPDNWAKYLHPDDFKQVMNQLAQCHKTGTPFVSEYRMIRKDAQVIWVHDEATIIKDSAGKPLYLLGVITDITKQKQADEALRESEEKYRLLFYNISDVVMAIDTDLKILSISPSVENILGYKPDELIGKSLHEWNILAEDYVQDAYDTAQKILAGEPLAPSVYEFITKDGERKFGEVSSTPLLRDGRVVAIVSIARDITKRKKTEDALRKSEERLQSIFRAAPIGIGLVSSERIILQVNDVICTMLGYSHHELIGKSARVLYPDDKEFEHVGKEKYRQIAHYGTGTVETKWMRKDGSIIDVLLSSSPIDPHDLSLGVTFTSLNITGRKQMEDALRESEGRFRTLVESSPIGIWQDDTEQRTLYVNQAMIAMLEVDDPHELYDHSWKPFFTPESLETINRETEKRQEGISSVYEVEMIGKKGKYFNVMVYGAPLLSDDGVLNGTIASFLDITERKKAEEALRKSELTFRSIVESLPLGMFIYHLNDDGRLVFMNSNPSADRILKVDCSQFIGKSMEEAFPHLAETEVPEMFRRAAAYGEPCYIGHIHLVNEGIKCTCEVHAFQMSENNVAVLFADITDRKHAEERLLLLKEAIESLPIGITISSTDGKIIYVNPSEAAMHGYNVDELTGKDARIFAPTEQWRPMSFEELHDMGIWKRESINIRKSGETFPVQLTSIAVRDVTGAPIGIIIACEDITARKYAEEELIRAEKLESLSVLASGIAHDFNNMLTIILTSIALAKHYAQHNFQVITKLQETEKEILLTKELTNQLLTFSKGGAPVKKLTSISELLADVTLFSLKGSGIPCEFSISDDLWTAKIDSGQISQVISNIIINAKQAMHHGGTINVSANNVTVDKENNLPLSDGNYVKISIRDEGIGIPDEHINKIFDPFFTTKEGGTGLGLSTSYSIIKNHQGYLSVQSTEGTGTTFTIYLPASEEKTFSYDTPYKQKERGYWRILLMEDEDSIRKNVTELLTTLGYNVESARDGSEAIEHYKTAFVANRPFHAVIMDLTISGGVGAIECIKELTGFDPGVKAILMSGYTSSPEMVYYKAYGFKGTIHKPFDIKEIDDTLQEMLHKRE